MKVIKRNGSEENLTKKKIFDSIVKANDCVQDDEKLTKKQIQRITDAVFESCQNFEEPIPVDKIEDMIELKLMESSGYEVAKKYITYRYEKERVRNNTHLTEKLMATAVANQNANMDEYSFGGRIGEASSYIMKEYAMNHLLSEKSKKNHINNEIYIHDLDHYAIGDHNCAERNVWVKVKIENEPITMRIGELADRIGVGYNQLADTKNANISILSRDGWTKLINITKRKSRPDENLITFKTRTGIPLKVTEDHRIPVVRDGKEIVIPAKDIKIGDSLLDVGCVHLSAEELNSCFLDLCKLNDADTDLRIVNLSPLKNYLRYRYSVCLKKYAVEHGFKTWSSSSSSKSITLEEFRKICDEYPISFDVLSSLQIKSNGSKHTYPLHIPYSKDLAKLYGYVYGDGGVYINAENSTYQLTFTNTNEEIMKDFVRCYENVFGYSLKISYPRPNWNSPCLRVVDGSRVACRIFKDFAGARKFGSSDISIPDFIMNGSDDIKYAFLSSAIDTDGCIADTGITYTTCGERYSDQFVLMLQGLGYHPHKTCTSKAGTKYRVGAKSGVRNFDVYNVTMPRGAEIEQLTKKMSCIKSLDGYAYRGLSGKFDENKVISIVEETGDFDVFDVETESHWFVGNNYVLHNCLSIPFDKLLAEGFNTRQTDVRPASSVNTAFQIVAVLFQVQSLQQFGGVAATHLDWTMVPYVRKSFIKHYLDGLKYIDDMCDEDILVFKSIVEDYKETDQRLIKIGAPEVRSIDSKIFDASPKAKRYAMDKTTKELNQAVEGMFHNLNTLQSRSGSQLPFSSVNAGTCVLTEGRMVIKSLIEGSISGVGKFHKTSIFPCGIFQCMKGVNRAPGDPNYDLFQLALKSTAQRLYPNYANVDWSTNAGYDVDDPRTYVSTMGCVDGDEVVAYKLNDGRVCFTSISRMWNDMVNEFGVGCVKSQKELGYSDGEYIDLFGVEILDDGVFVRCNRIIKNPDNGNWMKITFSNGRVLTCTSDHPFTVNGVDGEVKAEDMKIGYSVTSFDSFDIDSTPNDSLYSNEKCWLMGFIMCDGCYDHQLMSTVGMDEVDVVDHYSKCAEMVLKQRPVIREQHRGVKGEYIEIKNMISDEVRDFRKYLYESFGGMQKKYRRIPLDIFNLSRELRESFLAGMIDADGYINDRGCKVRVQIGSTNKEMAIETAMLVQTLGISASIYENHYTSKHSGIRYRVEFVPVKSIVDKVSSLKKREHFTKMSCSSVFNTSKVTKIEFIGNRGCSSYDVSTDSEHFMVSGIRSHNCRTYNGLDINGFGQMKDGRGNICPVTIIMPTLAMEADRDVDKFMELLDKKIVEAKDMLLERFDWICSQPVKSAKFMYENGTMFGYVPEEGIRSALKHGTIVIGQLGLAETLQLLVGCDQTEERGMELGKRIEQLFKSRCAEFKKQYKLNFGVYLTPAENLCYTSMQKFKAKYGVIENVSDKEFFTNSIHVPVWKKMDPFTKIDIESQLAVYSNAGCITYVELDSGAKNNLEALETIVNYAMDKDLPYFAINVPSDTCLDCGYQDEINDECPQCGSKDIQHLRRVTGYLTGDYKTAFNLGKQNEVEMRVKHSDQCKGWNK